MAQRIVPFFYFPDSGGTQSLGVEDIPFSEERKLYFQVPLRPPWFLRPRIRLFIPAGVTGIRFLSHHHGSEPTELWRIYPFARNTKADEDREEDFSAYEGGKLYELREFDQTIVLYQREPEASLAALTIVDVAGKQVYVRCYPLTVTRAEVLGAPDHIRERYQETLSELFNPSHEQRKEEEREEGGSAAEQAGRERARAMMEKMKVR